MLRYHYYTIRVLIAVHLIQWQFTQITGMLSDAGQHQSADCVTNSIETSLYCRGTRAMRNIINNLSKSDKPIVIVRGLEIVPARKSRLEVMASANNTHAAEMESEGQDSLIGRFSAYLRTHELNIKFSDLLTEESERYLARDLIRNGIQMNGSILYAANIAGSDNVAGGGNGLNGSDASEARKKDKGHGMMMMMAVMFSKLLAVLGMGGIGALALKALGVAMIALLVAGIVGLRSIMANNFDATPNVQYVTAEGHHHRRRRRSKTFGIITMPSEVKHRSEAVSDVWNPQPLAYGGWQNK